MSPALMRRAALTAALVVGFAGAAGATGAMQLTFRPHAAFFSQETGQTKPVDPQVFVKQHGAPPGVGPQGIAHDAGLRPALPGEDPKSAQLYSAKGKPLGTTLGTWLGATGSATVTPSGKGATVTATFAGLLPKGRYSLFENHFDQKPVGFTPADGSGTHNSFNASASGAGHLTVHLPAMPTQTNALLLVYHADGKAHGASRGAIGVDAEHQLIAPIPAVAE